MSYGCWCRPDPPDECSPFGCGPSRRRGAALGAALALAAAAACAEAPERSHPVPPPPGTAQSTDTVIVVYTHGSGPASVPDPCELERDGWPGTPDVIAQLDGYRLSERVIRVHRFCTPSRTGIALGDLHRAGDPAGLTHSKVMRRSADLLALARRYREEGVPANNIVLTGHSAGGFASLLAQLDAPDAVGRVVAFAPAFANTRTVRSAGEAWAREILHQRIAEANGLNALVFLFEEDGYERPQDVAVWRGNTGLRIEAFGGFVIEGMHCELSNAHRLAFDDCFTATQRDRIAEFILGGGSGAAGGSARQPGPSARKRHR